MTTNQPKIRVLIVDDHVAVAESMHALLSREREFELTEIAPDSTVIVIGNQTVVEIWALERWDSYFAGASANFTDNVNRVTQLR